jgi:hypothetical protein
LETPSLLKTSVFDVANDTVKGLVKVINREMICNNGKGLIIRKSTTSIPEASTDRIRDLNTTWPE